MSIVQAPVTRHRLLTDDFIVWVRCATAKHAGRVVVVVEVQEWAAEVGDGEGYG